MRQARSRDEGSNEQPEDIHEVIPQVETVHVFDKELFIEELRQLGCLWNTSFHPTKTGLLKPTLGRNYPKFLTAVVSYSDKKNIQYSRFPCKASPGKPQTTPFRLYYTTYCTHHALYLKETVGVTCKSTGNLNIL